MKISVTIRVGSVPTSFAVPAAIADTLQRYIDGARTGDIALLRSAFAEGARVSGGYGGKPVSWKIVESKPGAYAAERSDGLSSYANAGGILAPAFRYRDERGFDGTQRLVSGDPMAIYPIAVGKSAKFTADYKVSYPKDARVGGL